MRILFITPYLPSLIRVRPYNFIKALEKEGHSVYLVCLVQDTRELDDSHDIEGYCENVEKYYFPKYKSYWNCLKYSVLPVSLQSAYCFSKEMKKRVEDILKTEKFDLVHVEFIRATYFLPKDISIPKVFDSVDCVTSLYKQFSVAKQFFLARIVRYIEWAKLSYYEPKEAGRFDRIIVTSENEKSELKALSGKLPIAVIANGVDLEYFKPIEDKIEPFSVILTGKMSYFANELAALFFLKQVWPLVKKEISQAKLYIAGNKPGITIRKFASKDIIITDYVPDLRTYISKSAVVVAPIVVGAGIQNKILEAMSMGKPIVATSKACKVFPQDLIKDCLLIRDNPEDFSKAVINILNDTKLAESLGRKARRFVELFHNWDEKGKELAKVYRDTIEEKSGS